MSDDTPIVYVNQLGPELPLEAADVRRAVTSIVREEKLSEGAISVTFVEAAAIVALNEAHLGRSEPTDVIAFNLGEPGAPMGDVYICQDVAAQSAEELGIGVREELLRLVVHGTLHVLGYEHPDGPKREESAFFRRQEAILERLL